MTNSFDGPFKPTPVDRRTSITGLSAPMREVRIRNARVDIFDAIAPVSRDSESALNCLENEDDAGLEHHLRRVVDSVNKAARKHRELRSLLAVAPSTATVQEAAA
jgi:hypothetical protein